MTKVLLVESGSRSLIEGLIPHLRESWARDVPIDLVTCYGGLPAGFTAETKVYRVADYGSADRRNELVALLRAENYSFVGMICSGESIMTWWKWLIALRIPAKVFILNENGDYFWVNREHAAIVREFCLVRMGLYGEGSIRTIGRLLIFPFSVLFLLLYACAAHGGRIMRQILFAKQHHPKKL